MIHNGFSVKALNCKGLPLNGVHDFNYSTLDDKHLFGNIVDLEEVTSFFEIDSLHFVNDFVLHSMGEVLKVADRVNGLFQEEFDIVIVAVNVVLEFLVQFWVLLH